MLYLLHLVTGSSWAALVSWTRTLDTIPGQEDGAQHVAVPVGGGGGSSGGVLGPRGPQEPIPETAPALVFCIGKNEKENVLTLSRTS